MAGVLISREDTGRRPGEDRCRGGGRAAASTSPATPGIAGGHQKLETGMGPSLPRCSQKVPMLPAPRFQTFSLQSCERINVFSATQFVAIRHSSHRKQTHPEAIQSCRPADVQVSFVRTVLGVFWAHGPCLGHLYGFLLSVLCISVFRHLRGIGGTSVTNLIERQRLGRTSGFL